MARVLDKLQPLIFLVLFFPSFPKTGEQVRIGVRTAEPNHEISEMWFGKPD
jgi:hypothetical protein